MVIVHISDLRKGDGFLLRNDGKLYIYHCAVVEELTDDSKGDGIPLNEYKYLRYCVAYCCGHLHIFDTDKKVIKVADN